MHIGLGVDWGKGWDEQVKVFTMVKEAAQEAGESLPLTLGGHAFLFKPNGERAGSGSGPFYAFKMESEGMTLSIMKRPAPSGPDKSNVWLSVGSLALMESGAQACFDRACQIISALGGSVLWNQISRVDMCSDLPGVHVRDFCESFNADRFICRARKSALYRDGREYTGVSLGMGGDIACRMYDKLTESLLNERKLALLIQKRWGGMVDCATRVEFQLRRNALRAFGVDSFEDYMRVRGAVASYLCAEWLRFTSGDVDRTHTTRAETAPLWLRVARVFTQWTGEAPPARREKRPRLDGSGLVRSALGCLVSAVVRRNDAGEILTHKGLFEEIRGILWENMLSCPNLEAMQVRKMLQWHASGPSAFYSAMGGTA